MSFARAAGLVFLGLFAGGIVGGLVGLGVGLAYTQLANVSRFEGYSGFVVGYWIVAGIAFGVLAGFAIAMRRARR